MNILDFKKIIKESNLKHIAIIMDGNRRWAKANNLPSATGHKKGVDSLKNTVKSCSNLGIKYLTVYAFSTENWKRKQDEVSFLMKLLSETIKNELDDLHKNNVKITIIGDTDKLNENLKSKLSFAMDKTKKNTGLNLQIAINYGSRDEILYAVKEITKEIKSNKITPENITEEIFSKNLYTKNIPDPDLLIRTGGEKRISNYLLWQIAYSEILITDKFWPEFDENELKSAIIEFANRTRRFGAD